MPTFTYVLPLNYLCCWYRLFSVGEIQMSVDEIVFVVLAQVMKSGCVHS
jgi:hypothetical protein